MKIPLFKDKVITSDNQDTENPYLEDAYLKRLSGKMNNTQSIDFIMTHLNNIELVISEIKKDVKETKSKLSSMEWKMFIGFSILILIETASPFFPQILAYLLKYMP